MTWGDLFRLFKYFRRFKEWDISKNTINFRVFPALLEKDVILFKLVN